MCRNEKLTMALALTALAFVFTARQALAVPLGPANAPANSARIQYSKSRDGRYIYIRSAAQIEFANPEQAKALGSAFERIKSQIADLKRASPRRSNAKIDPALLEKTAKNFDENIDAIVSYMQKYYGELDSLRQYVNLATPTALLAFLGVNWSKTHGWTPIKVLGGGSVVMGVVILPQNVRRVEVDTGRVEEYFEFDTALIFWPTGNLGLAIGANNSAPASPAPADGAKKMPLACAEGMLGGSQRFGFGLIWGRLDQAYDFHGMITGVSMSGGVRVRGNVKLQALKNWSKKQAVSNVFMTAAIECGRVTPSLGIHGSLGYIVPGANFLGLSAGKSGSPEEVLANAAARMIDREAGAPVVGGGIGGGIVGGGGGIGSPVGAPLPDPVPSLMEEDESDTFLK